MDQLEKLAREMVGDGQSPNCFFFSRNDKVIAIWTLEDQNYLSEGEIDEVLTNMQRDLMADIVEDRIIGVVWERFPQYVNPMI